MTMEIVSFPIEHGGSFHRKLLIYQRVQPVKSQLYAYSYSLVGGFKHLDYFPIYSLLNPIKPHWNHIFHHAWKLAVDSIPIYSISNDRSWSINSSSSTMTTVRTTCQRKTRSPSGWGWVGLGVLPKMVGAPVDPWDLDGDYFMAVIAQFFHFLPGQCWP